MTRGRDLVLKTTGRQDKFLALVFIYNSIEKPQTFLDWRSWWELKDTTGSPFTETATAQTVGFVHHRTNEHKKWLNYWLAQQIPATHGNVGCCHTGGNEKPTTGSSANHRGQ